MQTTAAALAPGVMPMMSGLASGLRASVWKIAPETPKAAPTSSPVSARGSRSVAHDELGVVAAAPEQRRRSRRASGIGKSPTVSDDAAGDAASSAHGDERDRRRPRSRRRRAARQRRLGPRRRLRLGAATVATGASCHSSASLRRRTRAMKNGAPMSAVTIPTCDLAGPGDDAGR